MIPHLPEGRSRFEPALRLAIEGRWSDAVQWVDREAQSGAGEAHGDEACETLAEVARMAVDASDPAAADEALVAALRIRPRHADLLHQRAVVRLALGDRDEARSLLDRALTEDQEHVGARLERSMLEAGDGRLGEAIASLRGPRKAGTPGKRAPAVDPTESEEKGAGAGADAAAAEARRDLRDGRIEVAARRVDALIERHPATASLHAFRGEIEIQQGAWDDAVASCARSLELDPDDPGARLVFARALEGLGLREGALRQVALVLGRDPGNTEARALEERWSAGRRRARGPEITGSNRA